MSPDRKRSRRDLFTGWFSTVRDVSRSAVGQPATDPETCLRPPGALEPDKAFLEKCTGCEDCIPACPTSSISMVQAEGGAALPAINPSAKPCYLCTDLPCIAACGEAAHEDPGAPDRVRIGIARVDPRTCITFKGELCERCFKACPYPHQAIMMIGGRPLVGSGACTGCGLCEYACPVAPKAIRIVAERHLVSGLRIPKEEMAGG